MKIYTRTGDTGTTSLFTGTRVRKDALRVETYGTVDELNSHIGMARALGPSEATARRLEEAQNQLFNLGADLATPRGMKEDRTVRVGEAAIHWLEEDIDTMTGELEPLTHFILPGGSPAAAQLHIARTVCRRAERIAVALAGEEDIGEHALTFLNRLSDWLFTLARYENQQAGIPESRWEVRR